MLPPISVTSPGLIRVHVYLRETCTLKFGDVLHVAPLDYESCVPTS